MTRVDQHQVLEAFSRQYTPELHNLLAADLDRYPQFVFQQLYNRLQWNEGTVAAIVGPQVGEYRRDLAELPYHLTMAQEWDRVFATLTHFTFLERKSVKVAVHEHEGPGGESQTVYNGPALLQDDYRLALDVFPTE